jgi:hypothetical protein
MSFNDSKLIESKNATISSSSKTGVWEDSRTSRGGLAREAGLYSTTLEDSYNPGDLDTYPLVRDYWRTAPANRRLGTNAIGGSLIIIERRHRSCQIVSGEPIADSLPSYYTKHAKHQRPRARLLRPLDARDVHCHGLGETVSNSVSIWCLEGSMCAPHVLMAGVIVVNDSLPLGIRTVARAGKSRTPPSASRTRSAN